MKTYYRTEGKRPADALDEKITLEIELELLVTIKNNLNNLENFNKILNLKENQNKKKKNKQKITNRLALYKKTHHTPALNSIKTLSLSKQS